MTQNAPITVRCANPTCDQAFHSTPRLMSSNVKSDFLPRGWDVVYERQALQPVGYVCSVQCAMKFAARQHTLEPIAARAGEALRS